MNKSRKGWSRELQCRKELEEQGWTILFKSQSIRFGKVDFGPQNEKHEEAKFAREEAQRKQTARHHR